MRAYQVTENYCDGIDDHPTGVEEFFLSEITAEDRCEYLRENNKNGYLDYYVLSIDIQE